MTYLNPMLNNPVKVQTKPAALPQPQQPAKKTRTTRSDKKDSVRVPVDPKTREIMRTLAAAHGMRDKQSEWNSRLVLEALHEPNAAPEIDYADSGQYMTVKVGQVASRRIDELARTWGVSRRRVVHRLLMWMVDRRIRP